MNLTDEEDGMKDPFYFVTVVAGVMGLAAILVGGAPLTPENASLQTARAVIVIALVVIPYCMAGAIEKVAPKVPARWLPHLRPIKWGRRRKRQPVQTETLFFDYFFLPDSARDWNIASENLVKMKDSPESDTSPSPNKS
jgi:hypothetical protein